MQYRDKTERDEGLRSIYIEESFGNDRGFDSYSGICRRSKIRMRKGRFEVELNEKEKRERELK